MFGFLSSLLNGVLDAAADIGTTAFKYNQQEQMQNRLMDKQYNIWEKQQTNAYKLQRQGMLDAGINPAAYFGGSGGWKVKN